MSASQLANLYRTMARIRAFEELVAHHFRAGDIHGFVHVSIGQEAVAAGVCAALGGDDYITTTHRGHGHCLAKGADPAGMMAELFGRASGLCRGQGGSMHLADPALGILGANGVVGAGIPIAAGAALAARVRQDSRVAVAFFGEGALHTGAFHEGVTLAVGWQLPMILVCESNGWAEFTSAGEWGGPSPVERGRSYGMPSEAVDGWDVLAVCDVAQRVVGRCRDGGGPQFLEAKTQRGSGHYEGDAQLYRAREEFRPDHDPLTHGRLALGLASGEADAIDAAARTEIDDAAAAALAAPFPAEDDVLRDVYA